RMHGTIRLAIARMRTPVPIIHRCCRYQRFNRRSNLALSRKSGSRFSLARKPHGCRGPTEHATLAGNNIGAYPGAMMACCFADRLLAALLAAATVFGTVAVAAAEQPFAAMFREEAIFLQAIERERNTVPDLRVTGITIPHHLLAANLMARGFWTAAG